MSNISNIEDLLNEYKLLKTEQLTEHKEKYLDDNQQLLPEDILEDVIEDLKEDYNILQKIYSRNRNPKILKILKKIRKIDPINFKLIN